MTSDRVAEAAAEAPCKDRRLTSPLGFVLQLHMYLEMDILLQTVMVSLKPKEAFPLIPDSFPLDGEGMGSNLWEKMRELRKWRQWGSVFCFCFSWSWGFSLWLLASECVVSQYCFHPGNEWAEVGQDSDRSEQRAPWMPSLFSPLWGYGRLCQCQEP